MTQLDANYFTISEPGQPVVRSAPIIEQVSAAHMREVKARHAGWEDSINNKLIEWGRSPGRIDEDDLEMPSLTAVEQASKLALRFRDNDALPPERALPDGEGGIVFERNAGNVLEVIEFRFDGTTEYTRFEDCQLQVRRTFSLS